jgi:hypothetical protein
MGLTAFTGAEETATMKAIIAYILAATVVASSPPIQNIPLPQCGRGFMTLSGKDARALIMACDSLRQDTHVDCARASLDQFSMSISHDNSYITVWFYWSKSSPLLQRHLFRGYAVDLAAHRVLSVPIL